MSLFQVSALMTEWTARQQNGGHGPVDVSDDEFQAFEDRLRELRLH